MSAVLTDLVGNAQDIVRSEVRLAGAEIKAEAVQAARSGSLVISGAVLSLYAVGLLIALAVLLLSRIFDVWIATLIIFALVAVVATALILAGLRHWKKVHLTPDKTVRSVKENVSWMKAQVK